MNPKGNEYSARDRARERGWGESRAGCAVITIFTALTLFLTNLSFARVIRRQCLHPDGVREQLLEVIRQFDNDSDKGVRHLQTLAGRCLRIGWQRRAQMECPYGQVLLGLCRENGASIEQDHEEAITWYKKTLPEEREADQFRPAITDQRKVILTFTFYRLGEAYRLGKGVEQDEMQATTWYRKAAEDGHPRAIETLKKLTPAVEEP